MKKPKITHLILCDGKLNFIIVWLYFLLYDNQINNRKSGCKLFVLNFVENKTFLLPKCLCWGVIKQSSNQMICVIAS